MYAQRLQNLQTGARLTADQVGNIAGKIHPVKFVKSLLNGDYGYLASETGIDVGRFEALLNTIVDRGRLEELFDLQIVDVDDVIRVSLRLQGSTYRDIEELAHGQKCTVILMIALAEGSFPLVVDQPEDALHAPFIEENIVNPLRERRGIRQYVFTTRNANILVSGDAEQVIVLDGDSKRGYVKKTGSIDRFDTKELIVLHLEGGEEAFDRRRLKYGFEPPS
jgi:hypothetical protein